MNIFILTKPSHNERTKLCLRLIERSKEKDSRLYLVGDGVYNLLDLSIGDLPHCSIYACKEDIDARGLKSEMAIILDNFYEHLVKEMMLGRNRVYSF